MAGKVTNIDRERMVTIYNLSSGLQTDYSAAFGMALNLEDMYEQALGGAASSKLKESFRDVEEQKKNVSEYLVKFENFNLALCDVVGVKFVDDIRMKEERSKKAINEAVFEKKN